MQRQLIVYCVVILLIGTSAKAANTPAPPAVSKAADIVMPDKDWKYFGEGGTKKLPVDLFYLDNSRKNLPDGTMEVWIKSLKHSEVVKIDSQVKKYPVILNQSAARIAQYYDPPYGIWHSYGPGDAMWVTTYEIIADNEVVTPLSSMLVNLDCKDDQYRFLSITTVDKDGTTNTNNMPTEWGHIVPETNIDSLQSLVCPIVPTP